MDKGFDKETFKCSVADNVKNMFQRIIDEAASQQVFQVVAYVVKDVIIDEWITTRKEYEKKGVKTAYYLPMEPLIGHALGNNTINICARDETEEALDEIGFNLDVIEDQEPDAALGNGGLGRLATCFLDSLATLGYPTCGCGIRCRYGMFKQKIENGHRAEISDNWLKDGDPSGIRRPKYITGVKFGGYVRIENQGEVNHLTQDGYQSVRAMPYDLPVIGYGNNMANTLRIWDAGSINAFNLDSFNRGDYQKIVEQENSAKAIVEVLYPNDNYYANKEPRLRQQYFFIPTNVQRVVRKYKEKHDGIGKFYEKVVFQLNDTHSTIIIPELMRILLDEERLTWGRVQEVTARTCAYTNHTIISEALERWPIGLFSRLLPRIYQIVEEINHRFQNQIWTAYPGNQEKLRKMSIIYNGQMKVAYMAVAASFPVNGVARFHTGILKYQELKGFYEIMSEKFNNKTNRIAQRWFLLHGNPLLAGWVTSKIGDEQITDLPHIKKLKLFAEDKKYQFESMSIKYQNKLRLARYIKENDDIDVDPRSTLDVQVKRLHEYKRQLVNIFHVMYLYNQLEDNPDTDMVPRTLIFGAKAAAGCKQAKLTVEPTNSVADVINSDKPISGGTKVMFIEDYHVSNTELTLATADVSEQVSTASKGVSDTSSMKFMFNGALILGTMDGANIEIMGEIGADNAFIFGVSSDEITSYENNSGCYPMDIFNNDQEIRRVLMQLISGYYASDSLELFRDIYNSFLNTKSSDWADTYFILRDLRPYTKAHRRVDETHRDQAQWAKVAILNMANCGRFASDRAIEEYVKDTWYLKRVTIEMQMLTPAILIIRVPESLWMTRKEGKDRK